MIRSLTRYLLMAVLLAGCATTAPSPGEQEVRYGTIARIEPVSLEGDQQLGLGSIIGGIAGGVLGYQIGGGTGQAVASVAGALGGAFLGQKAQNKYAERRPGQHVIVQLGNGVSVGITQPADPNLRVGDPVRIDGTGTDARVVRR
jgi:outer membrane lipoprotein SlyB